MGIFCLKVLTLWLKYDKIVEVGDKVLASDPETGETEYKEVLNTYIYVKDTFVYVTIDGETIKTTKEHPFWVEGQGWTKAKFLETGDKLRDANGNTITIDNVKIVPLPENKYTFVYNFEVADFHTYYVADSYVLVHNVCEKNCEKNYVLFNKTHGNSLPSPKGTGPNGGRLQSHHGLQKQWAMENLSSYGYNPNLAPSITIETGVGMPHTIISTAQNARRNARIAAGKGKWSSTLQEELNYIVKDFSNAGFSDSTIDKVLEQQYSMLDKLKVPYKRVKRK